jgi:hypothetical protein
VVSGYDMKVWLGKFFLHGPRHVLSSEVHKRRESVRGGECVDARRNYITSKMFMLFVCGCYKSGVCLCMIRGVFILSILFKNVS